MSRARKEWTREEALQAHLRFLARGGSAARLTDPTAPWPRWWAMHELDALEKQHQGGEKRALATALRLCAVHVITMPPWVAAAYIAGHDAVDALQARWDEILGSAVPKGRHVEKQRDRERLSMSVWADVQRRSVGGQPITDEMFSQIGKHLAIQLGRKKPIGATTVKGYYKDGKRRAGEMFGPAAAQFFTRPK